MTYDDVITFVKQNPACSVATMDGDQPRVRWFLSVFFDADDRIYFTTSTMKNVGKQIDLNPKAELGYISQDFSRMLRITTELEDLDDREKKQEIIERQSYLRDAGVQADDPNFKLLRATTGKARFWELSDNLKEDELEVVRF